jgi:hypothetical protein
MGNPTEFAQQMNLSRSHLYNLLEQIKEMDAHIKYCKKKNIFIMKNLLIWCLSIP